MGNQSRLGEGHLPLGSHAWFEGSREESEAIKFCPSLQTPPELLVTTCEAGGTGMRLDVFGRGEPQKVLEPG